MTDNLKRAGIFRKSVYFFYGVRSWLLHFEYSEFSLTSSKKTSHTTNKKFPTRFLPANCAEISKMTSGNAALVSVYEIWKTDASDFTASIEEMLNTLLEEGTETVLLGDFNFDYISPSAATKNFQRTAWQQVFITWSN